MTSLTIDENQRLVRTKPAQSSKVDVICTIGTGLFIVVERRSSYIQNRSEIHFCSRHAGLVYLDHVNRHGCFNFCTWSTTCSSDNYITKVHGHSL